MSSSSDSTSNLLHGVTYKQTGETYTPVIRIGEQEFAPQSQSFTLTVDTTARYCLGWRDLEHGVSHPCPSTNQTDSKYDTCPACQKRTGFNPAFYHAASISPQQEKLNQEPHILYLAHFGDTYIKVGISRARRGIKRLLEQGARSALILDTFPTALIARQYEAQIAALSHIHETTSVSTKVKFLQQPYDPTAGHNLLLQCRNEIEQHLSRTFSTTSPQSFDSVYFSGEYTAGVFTALPTNMISGTYLGCVGDVLIMQHGDHRLALSLKQLHGYPASIINSITPLNLPPQQASLF